MLGQPGSLHRHITHLFSSSAMKKMMKSTRLKPGVNTFQSILRTQNLVRRRHIGSGLKKKTMTKTSQHAGQLLCQSSQHKE
jgi:hypothetical protein